MEHYTNCAHINLRNLIMRELYLDDGFFFTRTSFDIYRMQMLVEPLNNNHKKTQNLLVNDTLVNFSLYTRKRFFINFTILSIHMYVYSVIVCACS